MKSFKKFTSSVVSLPRTNVDTDMIIPAQYLTSVSRSGYGENLFRRLRDEESDFPLNLEKNKKSKILLVDDNFGCGSSREHAVWALMSWGFKAIIGKGFADIFKSNSGKNGLVLIELPAETIDSFFSRAKSEVLNITVDLFNQKITEENQTSYSFSFDPFQKQCILEGLDDIAYLLKYKKDITTYRNSKEVKRYYKTSKANF